ncbi:MAG: hypothetical protein PVH30_10450 [Desulfobacterales bacterium]
MSHELRVSGAVGCRPAPLAALSPPMKSGMEWSDSSAEAGGLPVPGAGAFGAVRPLKERQ